MREGVTEPGGCHRETSLCVNAGIHSQAPENLVPEKYMPDAKHIIRAPLLCSGFPFAAPG